MVINYFKYHLLDKCMSVPIYLIRKINKKLQNFYTLEHVFTIYAFNTYGTVAARVFRNTSDKYNRKTKQINLNFVLSKNAR